MRRSTATLWFFGLFAAAAAVIALMASGLVNFQALDKMTPQLKALLTPDAGPKTQREQLVEGAGDFLHLDAGAEGARHFSPPADAADAGAGARHLSAPADAGPRLKLAPGEAERLDAGEEPSSLLANAISFAQGTCTLNGTVAMKDGSNPDGRVVVYVETVPPDTGTRDRKAFAFTIKNHRLEPAVMAVVKDDAIRFLNPEGSEHNLFSKSGANEFQLGPKKDTLLGTRPMAYRGAVHLQCDFDEALSADVLVLPNTFFSFTKKGAFKIDGLPKGERNVTAWEPNGATSSQLVKCAGDTAVSLTLDPKPPLQRKHLDGTPYK
ncbi:MAG: hypothetical protein QM723_20735 [Myxococcaceae bacterium]